MLTPTLIMAALALALMGLGYARGQGEHIAGSKAALNMTIQTLPLLVFSFLAAGMAEAMIPRQTISEWVGAESGVRGLLLGTVAGAMIPGGPYVSLPVAAGLLRTGASIGTAVAFLTGWSLWGLTNIPMQVGIMGWRFTVARLASTFLFPPIAGLIAQSLFSTSKWG